jgi:hypothetical protein
MTDSTAPATGVTSNPVLDLLNAEEKLFAAPLHTFLTALQDPNVNYQAAVQDFNNLLLDGLKQEPAAQSVAINTVAASFQNKLGAIAPGLAAPSA